ncbi:MAG TPA: DUF4836 family protein [Chitinophagaceae bacterium]
MKKRTLLGLCSALALTVLLYSCSSADKNALPVPKDAAFVLHLNAKSLSSKLTWEELKQTNWFREGHASANDSFVKQLLQNPETSGIDTKDEIVFFVKRANESEGYAVVSGRIKDAAAFEAFNKQIAVKSEGNTTASKEGDVTSMQVNKKALASWSGDKFLYVIDMNTPKVNWGEKMGDSVILDSSGNVIPNPNLEDMSTVTPADLKGYAARLFKMSGDSLLVSDSRYTNLLKKDADMHLWSSAEHAYGGSLPFGMLSMLKLDNYFKNSVTTATLNFENGKIVLDAKSFSNEQMTALMKKHQGKDINTNLLQRIPSDTVLGVLIMNYPPEGLKEFLKLGGLDGMTNSFLAEVGLTLDDFISANKGDLMFAVTNFGWKERVVELGEGMEPYRTTSPDVQVVFANSIGNKASFDKLVEVGKKFGGEMNSGDKQFVFYNMNNDLFVAGSSQQLVDNYLQGNANKSFAFTDKIKDHPFGLYVDLQKVISRSARVKDSTNQRFVDESLKMWQDVVITGGEFNDGGVEQHMEVNLVDKNTNALKQINQYADRMHTPKKGF